MTGCSHPPGRSSSWANQTQDAPEYFAAPVSPPYGKEDTDGGRMMCWTAGTLFFVAYDRGSMCEYVRIMAVLTITVIFFQRRFDEIESKLKVMTHKLESRFEQQNWPAGSDGFRHAFLWCKLCRQSWFAMSYPGSPTSNPFTKLPFCLASRSSRLCLVATVVHFCSAIVWFCSWSLMLMILATFVTLLKKNLAYPPWNSKHEPLLLCFVPVFHSRPFALVIPMVSFRSRSHFFLGCHPLLVAAL